MIDAQAAAAMPSSAPSMLGAEHESLYGVRGEVDEDDQEPLLFGSARVAREGGDVTIIGVSRMALTAERAAETLAAEHGIEAEVIDPRTLRPLDLNTILASVAKTNHCVVVEEGWPHGGVGANLAALVSEQAFDDLDAPVLRVSGADVPMPYSKPLEEIAFPHESQIVGAALAVLGIKDASAQAKEHEPGGEREKPVEEQNASLAAQQPHADAEIREAQL